MLRFLISNKRERQHFEHLSGPIEFGRGPERDGITRCIIQDGYISRDHVKIEEQPDGKIRVENLSARNSIRVMADNSTIGPSQATSLKTPLRLSVGETLIEVETAVDPIANAPLDSIAAPVRQPARGATTGEAARAAAALQQPAAPPMPQQSLLDLGKTPSAEKLMEW